MTLLPLNKPPDDYRSLGPWLVSYEWADGMFASWSCDEPTEGLRRFWHCTEILNFDADTAPDRRVMVNARGVTVCGYLRGESGECKVLITAQLGEHLVRCGVDAALVLDFELTARWSFQ